MGLYVNPGNIAFAEVNDSDYVDKTLLIDNVNRTIGKGGNLICNSRLRRSGKSWAARMLVAYYDASCDSHPLFDDKKIALCDGYLEHLNRYNVIYLEITSFISQARREGMTLKQVPDLIVKTLSKELDALYPSLPKDDTLSGKLISVTEMDGRRFIFVIDEWDAVIREGKNDPDAQTAYLELLREWFKNGIFTPKVVAAAYMTGILPIKKDGSQSAISDFCEYTMIKPGKFAPFIGFTEDEVIGLCASYHADFTQMKRWYDGYEFSSVGAVYNPNSVMKALQNGDFDSYWTETSAAEGLIEYISQDYNGLTKTVAELIGGIDVSVETAGFANDLPSFKGKDDVLTLMIHLGYLAYNAVTRTVRIPNEEIKREFQRSIHVVRHTATLKRLKQSEDLFLATIRKDEAKVAEAIEKIHAEETAPLHYNMEQSLRSVIKLAYYTYRDHYLQFEELPSGSGYADVVYIPLPDSDWPPLVIELKWNKSAEGAIEQIEKKNYPKVLENINRPVLLVGITYDRDQESGKRKHSCRIVEYRMDES